MNYNDRSILFAGSDLEIKDPRGIAFYAKSVMNATNELSYQNYILTSAKSDKYEIIQQLKIARKIDDNSLSYNSINISTAYLKDLIGIQPSKFVDLDPQITLGVDKLKYLESVTGCLNKPNIYQLIGLHSRLFKSPYTLKLPKSHLKTVFCFAPTNIRVEQGVKLVQTLHDTIPLSTVLCPPDDLPHIYYKKLKTMLIYSDIILSVSEFSRQELLKIFPGYEKKIITTYQPVPVYKEENIISDKHEVQSSVLKKYNLQAGEYLLFVGAIEKRKNVLRMIEAHLAVYEQIGIPLVIIGSLGYCNDEVNKYLNDKKFFKLVKYFNYVQTIDKLVLLKKARAFIFPSLSEGFGLPPIEAMRIGCPVLTSNTSVMPEVCGDAALYVDPLSLSDIAKGILEIASNQELRQQLIAKGFNNANRFSMDIYKDKLDNILSNLHE